MLPRYNDLIGMRPTTFITRALIRLAAGGAIALVAVGVGGRLLERQRFGGDVSAARSRLAAVVQSAVQDLERRFERIVAAVPIDASALQLASQHEPEAERRLFEQLTAASASAGDEVTATLYGTTLAPMAWTGRPVELPDARITGTEVVFLVPDAQGLRLVHVHPLPDPRDRSQRVGTLVLQAPLARVVAGDETGAYELPEAGVPVRIRPRFEGGIEGAADEVVVRASNGDTLAAVSVSDVTLVAARDAFRARMQALMLGVVVGVLLLATGPLLDWRRLTRRRGAGLIMTVVVAAVLGASRFLAGVAIDWAAIGGNQAIGTPGLPRWVAPDLFFASPLHFLASSLLVAGLVAAASSAIDFWRLTRRGAVSALHDPAGQWAIYLSTQVLAGFVATALMIAYGAFIRYGVASVPADILHFGLRPWDWARLALLTGVIVLNVSVVALAVLVYRLALLPWATGALTPSRRAATAFAWILPPVVMIASGGTAAWAARWPAFLASIFVVAVAWRIGRVRAGLRRASQAARLLVLMLGIVLPSLAFYPTLVDAADRARRAVVETVYAPEVLDQRRTLQARLAQTLRDIDRLTGLDDLVRAADPDPEGAPPVDAAFLIWSQTELSRLRLTSSIELYNGSGALVSRFSLKLPDVAGAQTPTEVGCAWDIFEEVSPFFAEERRLLHAGRALCRTEADGRERRVGQLIVHLMLDYGNLSFVSAQSPYVALMRSGQSAVAGTLRQMPVAFSVYGWSGKVLYTSENRARPLDASVLARAASSRTPFWSPPEDGDAASDAYVLNDRGAIYLLSTKSVRGPGHLTVMAELISLAFVAFVLAISAGFVYGRVAARTPTSGRALLREVRASFYRKLFLAFVASAVVPVVALAFVARAYFASLLFADIEMEATRTATEGSRVVEDFGSLQVRGLAAVPNIDDNIVVWLSRVIAQDVNVFDGPQLLASSERNLFASGLLPTRTPGEAYRAILLEGRPSFVGRESVGPVEYLVAAAPVRIEGRDAILMVPLTSRQQEIEAQVEELDRRVLLAALVFIMVGAGIGYSMAERIADPVNRLMRATRRIAQGDLDARVIATSSDELRRLVEAFNRMAEDLHRQRGELERTNRLAAWADMARQVAHDIKNPLTPIQLNAEHMQRVHADRGRPLGPLVDDCVANILGQVRLLRQISAEFSSFASSPQPRPVRTDLAALLEQILAPYRAGLGQRVRFEVAAPADTPHAYVDPLLISRALTNVIENALHAMPNGGELRFTAEPGGTAGEVLLRISDTGIGMDADALGRIFEPYFSTKTTGTGLGLTIAKRNVEANGGRVELTSEPGRGTTVTFALPAAPA
jgi:signal transduction histidine kinase